MDTMASMNSFEVLSIPPNNAGESVSFNYTSIHDVVIPHATEVPQNGHLSQNGYISFDYDSSLNDKLEKLLEENAEMREKIQRQNKAIPELIETVSKLKAIVESHEKECESRLTVTEAVKKQFQEKNETLKKMNDELNFKIEELNKEVENLRDELDQHNKQKDLLQKTLTDELRDKRKLSDDMKDREIEHKNLREAMENQKEKCKVLEGEMEKLCAELANLKIEFKLLEEEKNDYKAAYMSLQAKEHGKETVEPACNELHIIDDEDANGYSVIIHPDNPEKKPHELEDITFLEAGLSTSKFDYLSIQLDEEKHMSKNLLQLLEEKDVEVQKLKEMNEKLVSDQEKALLREKELAELKAKLEATISMMQEAKSRADQSALKISELQQQVEHSQRLLEAEKANSTKIQEKLLETEHGLQKLGEEKQQLSLFLDGQSSGHADEEERLSMDEKLSIIRADVEQQSLMKLDGLVARQCYLEEELEQERRNVASLTRQLAAQNGDSEPVEVLKTQVNMYKSDFEVEKSARLSAQEEVERLNKMMVELQKQLEERKSLESHENGHASRRKFKSRHSNGWDHQNSNSSSEPCPCCGCTFFSYKDLERHALECSDRHRDF